MAKEIDNNARRIAEKGREALLERLRGAFEEAAVAHADVFESDPEKLERMVQHAADRADGLQWRRALATAATDELGIGLAEALSHPAVARAQTIVGAPSYEEGLAAITEGKAPPPGAGTPGTAALEAEEPPAEPAGTEAAAPAQAEEQDLEVNIGVLYLDGLPELGGVGNLELRFSDGGLDVVSELHATALVHFDWSELHGIEVQPWRARRRRRHSARLIVTATARHGTFETRGANLEEAKQRLAPAVAKLGAD
jgi:hypothetical protein